ncbi:MAG: flagellar export chaperone FliS [Thermoleophilaceae bacterium]|nr:flagellar export chaperone FliS [Thermoleophilaceae bacterium]
MNLATAPQAYKESAVLTAPPERLVVMLYDGAIRFLRQGKAMMSEGRIEETNKRLQRGEAIIDHLLATLDMEAGGELAERLQAIYLYSRRHLTEARVKRDPERIENVIRWLSELRDAWARIAGA